jgi:hypothetical protein
MWTHPALVPPVPGEVAPHDRNPGFPPVHRDPSQTRLELPTTSARLTRPSRAQPQPIWLLTDARGTWALFGQLVDLKSIDSRPRLRRKDILPLRFFRTNCFYLATREVGRSHVA